MMKINDNELDMVILPSEKVDNLTDEEDVNENTEKLSKLPFDIAALLRLALTWKK